jgi:drug/metabolite transporter (DMT)-like permease
VRGIPTLPRPVWGCIAMAAGAACLAGNHSLVRVVAAEVGALETSALRFLWALPMMLPWMLRGKGNVLRTRRHGMHFVAAALTVVTTVALFFGLAQLPLALVTSLNFSAPLFTTLLAVLLLKERVGIARWAATLVGFSGVLIILRPGLGAFDPAALLPIFSAFTLAFWYLALKRLGASESTATITVYQTLWAALLLTLLALPGWQTPSASALVMSVAMAALGTGAIFLMARAFDLADASLLAPLDYARLPFITLIAFFAFGEIPDLFTIAGAVVIVGAAIFMARREARTQGTAEPGA